MDLALIQEALRKGGFDGWLFYDFHHRCPISYRVLGLDRTVLTSRRWFYFIPARGEPLGLAHRVEPNRLQGLPGRVKHYLSWRELECGLASILDGVGKVAMQYSPGAAIPTVSTVDAGTYELVRKTGVEILSSASLVQAFEAVLGEEGYRSHREAGEKIQKIKDGAFQRIGEFLGRGRSLTEYGLQQWILARFDEEGLDCMGEFPIVGIDDHQANPHFQPSSQGDRAFRKGAKVLIDLWARLSRADSVFYDITWCGHVGSEPDEEYVEIFALAVQARDAGLALVEERFAAREVVYGYEVDDVCRAVIVNGGHGEHFIHRTGHSITDEVHGAGANMDNLETHDDRAILPGTCFSIEPGIYLPGKMAVRTEIGVFVRLDSSVEVIGPRQRELLLVEVP